MFVLTCVVALAVLLIVLDQLYQYQVRMKKHCTCLDHCYCMDYFNWWKMPVLSTLRVVVLLAIAITGVVLFYYFVQLCFFR